MNKNNLKKWRIIVIATLATALTSAILNPVITISGTFWNKLIQISKIPTISFIIFWLFAYLFYEKTKYLYLSNVRTNIKTRLLDISTLEMPYKQAENILSSNTLMGFFWNIVDNDKSLSKKSEDIMLNGLIITFISTLFLFSFFNNFIQAALILFGNLTTIRVKILVISNIVAFCAYFAEKIFVKIHLAKSNEQLDYIESCKASEIKELLKNYIDAQNDKS